MPGLTLWPPACRGARRAWAMAVRCWIRFGTHFDDGCQNGRMHAVAVTIRPRKLSWVLRRTFGCRCVYVAAPGFNLGAETDTRAVCHVRCNPELWAGCPNGHKLAGACPLRPRVSRWVPKRMQAGRRVFVAAPILETGAQTDARWRLGVRNGPEIRKWVPKRIRGCRAISVAAPNLVLGAQTYVVRRACVRCGSGIRGGGENGRKEHESVSVTDPRHRMGAKTDAGAAGLCPFRTRAWGWGHNGPASGIAGRR